MHEREDMLRVQHIHRATLTLGLPVNASATESRSARQIASTTTSVTNSRNNQRFQSLSNRLSRKDTVRLSVNTRNLSAIIIDCAKIREQINSSVTNSLNSVITPCTVISSVDICISASSGTAINHSRKASHLLGAISSTIAVSISRQVIR